MTAMCVNDDKSFYITQICILTVSALCLIFIYPLTQLDEALINPYYDPVTHQFLLKKDFLLEMFMHKGLKYLMMIIALITCWLWMASFKFDHLRNHRSALIYTFIGMVIATTAVSLTKRLSPHACPWDLSLYGGDQPLLALFEPLPSGINLGQCFPAGHASGGFALWSFYFFFRNSQPKVAITGLYAGAFFGAVMGWAQMMRGAHFMSHNLWSAWLVWLVLLTLYFVTNQSLSHKHPIYRN